MSEWISVSDSLPKAGQDVLVCDEYGEIGIGRVVKFDSVDDVFWSDVFWSASGASASFESDLNPTKYWMPLPEAPK